MGKASKRPILGPQQAQSRAAEPARGRGFRLAEVLEQALQVVRGDADAGDGKGPGDAGVLALDEGDAAGAVFTLRMPPVAVAA